MLAAVGLDTARCRFVDFSTTLVRCDQLIISTYDRFNSEIRPDLIKVHETLLSKSDGPQESGRMIFISRPPGSSRSLLNRDAVEAAASKLGYEIVRPEQLLFSEQIRLFASARVVLGECGSGMHNTLYCAPGTRVGVVQSATNQNFLQAQIALMKQQDIFYVIGKQDKQIEHAFSVEIQDIRNVAEMMRAP
jgi:capsular polysaccharide biosynthesis protein